MKADFWHELVVPAQTKIVLLVMDGLGGLPCEPGGPTELESAHTPHLDALAAQSALGLTQPAGPGVTVGSGPGHLALFGYDPVEYAIGRGALEALGVDLELRPGDVAARGNFCTLDAAGVISDRRAGRLASEASQALIARLNTLSVEGAQISLRLVKEHRFALVLRGEGLEAALSDTDPLAVGARPLPVRALAPEAEKAARLINAFLEQAHHALAGQAPANMITLRGFAGLPHLPTYSECYGLKAAAIALHGMYRGVARLAGMDVLAVGGSTLADQFATLERCWPAYDFFYLHVKKTDTCGEAGDFAGKVRAIEEVDAQLPRLLALHPDVVVVGGDHSSPAVLQAHSWHPVPVLLYARHARADGRPEFGERACAQGSLGVLPATHILPLALAHAGRLTKYGA